MSRRHPAECVGFEVITAARLREQRRGVVGGCEFLIIAIRYDGASEPCWVPTLAGLVEMIREVRPPNLHVECAADENSEALRSMLDSGSGVALH